MTTWKRSSRLDNHTTIQREDGTKLFRVAGASDEELALAVAAPKLLEACKYADKWWGELESGLVQAAERGGELVHVGDLLTAVRAVTDKTKAAILDAESSS